jgi:septal ring factor EnvC (AmiA/AmiB activator)
MSENDGLNSADTPAAGAPATPVKAGGTSEEAALWQQRYNELQAQHEAVKKAQSGSDSKVAELTRQLQESSAQIGRLNEQLGLVDTEKSQTAEVLTNLNEQVRLLLEENATRKRTEAEARWLAEQTQLITSKYPALLPLLQAGALPAAQSVEELDAKLAAVSQLTSNVATQHVDNTLSGARPPGPGAQTPNRTPPDEFSGMTKNQLFAEMQTASQARDWERYRRLQGVWYNTK